MEQFKVTRSKKAISQPQATETPDEILFRIIDTEIKRSGQLVYGHHLSPRAFMRFLINSKSYSPNFVLPLSILPLQSGTGHGLV